MRRRGDAGFAAVNITCMDFLDVSTNVVNVIGSRHSRAFVETCAFLAYKHRDLLIGIDCHVYDTRKQVCRTPKPLWWRLNVWATLHRSPWLTRLWRILKFKDSPSRRYHIILKLNCYLDLVACIYIRIPISLRCVWNIIYTQQRIRCMYKLIVPDLYRRACCWGSLWYATAVMDISDWKLNPNWWKLGQYRDRKSLHSPRRRELLERCRVVSSGEAFDYVRLRQKATTHQNGSLDTVQCRHDITSTSLYYKHNRPTYI